MAKRTLVLRFPPHLINEPITYRLVKDYDLAINILSARVKPQEEGNVVVGVEGEKVVPIEDFFTGPGETVINHGQLLTEVQVPNLALRSGGSYIKHTRRQGADLAVVGVAALVTIDNEILANGLRPVTGGNSI